MGKQETVVTSHDNSQKYDPTFGAMHGVNQQVANATGGPLLNMDFI